MLIGHMITISVEKDRRSHRANARAKKFVENSIVLYITQHRNHKKKVEEKTAEKRQAN
jgi:hypothetical protein